MATAPANTEPYPLTEFFKQGRLLFAIVDGRYYHAANAQAGARDYLSLCDQRFPLQAGAKLHDEEKIYLRKHKTHFDTIKQKLQHKISGKISSLQFDKSIKEDVLFFLKEICIPYQIGGNFQGRNIMKEADTRANARSNRDELHFYEAVLPNTCAVINRRVYPLNPSPEPVFASLRGQRYTLGPALATVEQMEQRFYNNIEEQIVNELVAENRATQGIAKEIEQIGKGIAGLEVALGVVKHPHSYEFSAVGYDTSIQCVYHLVEPHNNRTSGERYGEGQSAVTLPMNIIKDDTLSGTAHFANRATRNEAFYLRPESHCLGKVAIHPRMVETTLPDGKKGSKAIYPLQEKIYYLRNVATTVHSNGAFHA